MPVTDTPGDDGLIDGQARACDLALAFLDSDIARFGALLVEADAAGAVVDLITAMVAYWAPLMVSVRGESSARMLLADTAAAARHCLQEDDGAGRTVAVHRCDPTFDQAGSPLTMVRTLRLVLAYLADGDLEGGAGTVFSECAQCPQCLIGLVTGLLGFAVGIMPEHGPEVVDRLTAHLAQYVDQLPPEGS